MVDQEPVCCMCGDVGFADKLFRCSHCRFRFQHLYCSNYYNGTQELLSPSSSSSSSIAKSTEICDWCQSEGITRNSNNKSFKRSSSMDHHHHHHHHRNNNNNLHIRSEYTSTERIKQHHTNSNSPTAASPGERATPKNNNSGVPSPRPSAHRRYKLLKDVMC